MSEQMNQVDFDIRADEIWLTHSFSVFSGEEYFYPRIEARFPIGAYGAGIFADFGDRRGEFSIRRAENVEIEEDDDGRFEGIRFAIIEGRGSIKVSAAVFDQLRADIERGTVSHVHLLGYIKTDSSKSENAETQWGRWHALNWDTRVPRSEEKSHLSELLQEMKNMRATVIIGFAFLVLILILRFHR